MAQIEKYNIYQAMAVIAHCERTAATHSNPNIDMSRTEDNFALWPPDNPDRLILDTPVIGQSSGKYADRRLRKRLAELSRLQRNDVNVLCDWCLHLGVDVPPGYESKVEFYRAAVDVLAGLYGPENVVYAWVHEDEVSSHLHFGFIPVVKKKLKLRKNASAATKAAYEQAFAEGRTVIERVDANALINRKHLQSWHGWLTKRLKERLGYDPGVHTGITQFLGGNATVAQLKRTGPDWREKRNKKVNAYHNARRAYLDGTSVSIDDRITLSDPKTKELQGPSMSLDDMIANAKGRSGKQR